MELLEKGNVRILESAENWKDAIRKAVLPLEESGFVEARYKEEIIAGVEKLGPYIIVAPSIALPHARPEQGVIKSQIAITLFKHAINFDKENTSAKLFVTLATSDSNSHLNALVSISDILQDEGKVEKILKAEDAETLYRYFE